MVINKNAEKGKLSYKVIRSSRRTIAVQINADGTVVVRSPRHLSAAAIDDFVGRKSHWIEKHVTRIAAQPQLPALAEAQIQALAQQARVVIPERVAYYASLAGVTHGKITVRNQRARWGSCSSKGNLSFNCLLMLLPREVMDYVVVHELCHRKEMNHSKSFWAEVERVLPDYKARKKWLKENGEAIIRCLPEK